MAMLRTISTALLSRTAARRLGRVIPNPLLRMVVVAAATRIAPVIAAKAGQQWRVRQAARTQRRALRAGAA